MSNYTQYSTDPAERLYPLRLYPVRGWLSSEELKRLFTEEEIEAKRRQLLGLAPCHSSDIYAEATGERRPPKKGEWYLSGAIVEAWRAPNDLSAAYPLARLVRIQRIATVNVVARIGGPKDAQEAD